MIKLPQKRWSQNNRSDTKGDLWSSWNLDTLSNEDKLRVAVRTIVTTDDITDLGVPVGFQTFTDNNAGIQYAWAVAGSYVFRTNILNGYTGAFAKDSSTGTPTNCSSDTSDIASFGKTFMVVTVPDDIFRYNPATGQWNDGANELTSGTVHMLCVYGTRFYVTDENTKIKSFTPAAYAGITTSGSNTLNLANKGWNVTSITSIRPASDGIWVFTINQSEDGCWVFKWDGAKADDPNSAYLIPDASGILAGIIKSDVPWVIDNNAQLRVFNGQTFVKTEDMGLANGRLPVRNAKFLKNPLSASNDRWIHPNGIDIVDGRIRILINNEYEDNGATIEENLPSGVWEYDTQLGWRHVMSLSLYVNTITDYGQNRVSRVGALYATKNEGADSSANGTMLLGAQLFSDASSTKEVILIDDSNDSIQKFGYAVTQKIYSSQIKDVWSRIFVRLRKLLNSGDRVWVRYRTDESDPTEATITWTSSTTFTTTTNVSAYEGYEVEVLQGKGAGRCEKITDVSDNAGTYTVTVASAFTGATSGTAKARFQYWKDAGVVFSLQTEQVVPFPIEPTISSPWIQLKICMQFLGKDEIDDIIILNQTSQEGE